MYICERCQNKNTVGTGKDPIWIVHHKVPITPQNIHDPQVTLSWDNLELLCITCHNMEHSAGEEQRAVFDSEGNVVGVKKVEGPPGPE